MKRELNTFFLDEPVRETLNNLKKRKPAARINRAGDSIIACMEKNGERRNILFRPDENRFTYEVNGHSFGAFFYEEDKVVVKWPPRLKHRDHKSVINELQQIFRSELT